MKFKIEKYQNPIVFAIHSDEEVNQNVINHILNIKGVLSCNHDTDLVYTKNGIEFVKNKFSLHINLANTFFSPESVFESVKKEFCR